MVIDKLILHDFGVYGGYQEIVLTPTSATAPIVLFGGLNGAGKTTLLDALQLCLFGSVAKCSNKNGQGYSEYLASCINKRAVHKEAMIGLDFRHTASGKESSYRIRRSWRKRGKSVAEEFTVHINTFPAKAVTNNWLHHIEEIMPANIAHLFFFDGEESEGYVMAENAGVLIETAVLNLLGLDIVSQLEKDLKTLERRKAINNLDSGKQAETKHIETAIEHLGKEIEDLRQEQARLQTYEIDRKTDRLAKLQELFRKVGGELYERRNEIEASLKSLQDDLANCGNALVKMTEGCLPLVLAWNLLASLEQRDVQERKVIRSRSILEDLERLERELLAHLRRNGVDKSAEHIVKSFLAKEIDRNRETVAEAVENPMDEHARRTLHVLKHERLTQILGDAEKELRRYQDLKQKVDDAALEWAGIPKKDDVKDVLSEREAMERDLSTAKKKYADISGTIEVMQRQIEQHEAKLKFVLGEAAETWAKKEDQRRILTHSEKARGTLKVFRHRIVRRHIRHIQALVLENYQSLLRKDSLISRIVIDPETFQVGLYDDRNHPIPADRLSAGERQLLAISMLWGMAKASGRPLPTAIDTPLGRLDAMHRKHLVCRYFPYASHQVLLFSTDQEVHGEYLRSLKTKVGRSYHLEYNDRTGTTAITEGYLQ